MSVVLVTGGTGSLGTPVVDQLRARGHEVRVLSRGSSGTHVGDLTTGAGVAEAAAGARLIVHLATDSRRLGRPDPRQTANLLRAARDADHLLYISIVGIEQIPFPYYRKKLECEELVERGGIPHTILRATQFHDLLAGVLRFVTRLPVAPLPLDLRFQPVDTSEVAARLVDLIEDAPAGRAPDFGGPEVLTLGQLADIWRGATGTPRRVVGLPAPGRIARGFREGRNTCPEHRDGVVTFAQYAAGHSADPYRR